MIDDHIFLIFLDIPRYEYLFFLANDVRSGHFFVIILNQLIHSLFICKPKVVKINFSKKYNENQTALKLSQIFSIEKNST